jgi:hypothetical protein
MSIDRSPDIMSILASMTEELRQVRADLAGLRERPAVPPTPRTYYSVEEVSKMFSRSCYTVREWCRHGQVNAVKKAERRGAGMLWNISAEEVARYRNEGLLPIDPDRNNRN